MLTSPDALWSPDAGDTSSNQVITAAMQDSVQEAFNSFRQSGATRLVGPGVSRPAFGQEGRVYFDTTTDTEYLDTGSTWDNVTPGFVFLRRVQFTAVSTITLASLFSARFEDYVLRFKIRSLSSAGSVGFQYLSGTTPASGGSDYLTIAQSNSGATVTGSSVVSGNGSLTKASVAALYGEMRIMDPALAGRTVAIIDSHGVGSTSAAEIGNLSVQHNPETAYDGLRLITSGPSISGSLSVYGLR